MSFWKLGAALATALAAVGVSAQTETIQWRAGILFGGCSLVAEKADGGTWNWVSPSNSKTRFNGTWPTGPGELYLTKRSAPPEPPLTGFEPAPPDETLTISFTVIDGKSVPVSYQYDDVKTRLATKGKIQPHNCVLR